MFFKNFTKGENMKGAKTNVLIQDLDQRGFEYLGYRKAQKIIADFMRQNDSFFMQVEEIRFTFQLVGEVSQELASENNSDTYFAVDSDGKVKNLRDPFRNLKLALTVDIFYHDSDEEFFSKDDLKVDVEYALGYMFGIIEAKIFSRLH